jgi:hypothetical protein
MMNEPSEEEWADVAPDAAHEHRCRLWPGDARHTVCECECGAIADGPIEEDGTREWRLPAEN